MVKFSNPDLKEQFFAEIVPEIDQENAFIIRIENILNFNLLNDYLMMKIFDKMKYQILHGKDSLLTSILQLFTK
jgi:hypothetical protein